MFGFQLRIADDPDAATLEEKGRDIGQCGTAEPAGIGEAAAEVAGLEQNVVWGEKNPPYSLLVV